MPNIINQITLNGSDVNFKYGLSITDVLNKNLNTGVLVIPQTNNLTIEPFDEVVIRYETTKYLYMIVGGYRKTITKFSGTEQYNYELTLVSPTLKLQRIVLPARSITRKISVDSTLTIRTIMLRYLAMYMPGVNMTSRLTLLTNVPCPEMSWNRPTLFEVFNDLLITLGVVVTMDGFNFIDYLDLSSEGSQIDESYINNYEYSRDISEYASAVEVEAQNVYSKDSITKTASPISIRTTESIKITTENQEIVLQKPIFTIEKVLAHIRFFDTGGNTDSIITDLDITNRVVEKSVYDLLTSSNDTSYISDTSSVKYRRNHLFFAQGDNKIQGLNFREDNWLSLVNTKSAISHVIVAELKDVYGNTYAPGVYATEGDSLDGKLYDEITFTIEYTTTDNVLFRTRKDVKPKHESILINNQTNSFVYSDLLGKQQQEFVNRIGNEELKITGRYENYNDIPNLSDYINEYKLVEREIQFHGTYYLFVGKLTEYYSAENMFAGINTQKRYTELASISDSFNSNHITEKFYEFGFSDKAGDSETFTGYIIPNYGVANKTLDGAIVNTKFSDNTMSDNFLLNGTPYHFGYSFVYTIRMEDNINVGYQLENAALIFSAQQNALTKYTDDFGNFQAIKIRLYSEGGIKEEAKNPTHVNNFSSSRNFLELTNNAAKLPVIENLRRYYTSETSYVDYNPLDDTKKIYEMDYVNRYKDNREVTFETLQFHIFPNNDIILTDKFYKYLPPLYFETSNEAFKVAYSTTETYSKGNTSYKGNIIPSSEVTIIKLGNKLGIQRASGTLDFDSFTSWALLDNDNNLLIGVNEDGNQAIWLNEK